MRTLLNCILLIDDDAVTNLIHKKAIEKSECTKIIQIVESGEEALEYLTNQGKYANIEAFPTPDLIFLDINMPGMSGWDFLEEFQKLPERTVKSLIIMMLSASINPDDAERAKSISEVSGFKNKPLTKELLYSIIDEFFPDKSMK